MTPKEKIALAVEVVGVFALCISIYMEIIFKADWGFFLISGSALVIAFGSLLWVKVLKR